MLVVVTIHLRRKKRCWCLISGDTDRASERWFPYGSPDNDGTGNGLVDGTGRGTFEINESMRPVT